MMSPLKSLFAALVVILMTALPAQAGALGDAKAAGLLGERPDGYVGLVGAAPQSIVDLMKSVNSQRRAHYQGVAQETGTSLQNVEILMGKRQIDQLNSGLFYMDGGGRWVKK
ncbi:hypothetical protein JCM17960_27010 [Magnetospira thiophila]